MSAPSLECEISSGDKVFFLHIPKTAGTTLAAILEHHFDKDKIFPFYQIGELSGVPKQVFERSRYIRGHFYYDAVQKFWRRKPVTITMLRDPIERFLSHFAQTQRATDLPESTRKHVEHMSIDDFIDDTKLLTRLGFLDRQTRMIATKFNFDDPSELPQLIRASYMPEASRIETQFAVRLLETFAFFGLSERFQDSLYLLAYTFGWQPIGDFQKLNVAPLKPHRRDISPDTLNRIAAKNALDMELYKYAQQLFETRVSRMTQELLDNYGDRSHASLNYPLPVETLHGLLERHYERRFAGRYKPLRSLHFKFDQALQGTQWHLVEISPEHGPFRWSGPGPKSTLDFPLARDTDLLIKFRILMTLAPDVLESLRLTVNDQPIPLSRHSDATGALILTGRIPRAAIAGDKPFVRLQFEINRTIVPQTLDPNSPDTRQLGCAFNWLQIEPV